jgi:hypothetical protein
MGGTEFDPGTANTGEPFIVSLTLPAEAKSVRAGASINAAFKNFSALTEFNAVAAETIGDWAFGDNGSGSCTTLKTLNLPAMHTLGNCAFLNCESLKMANLPAAHTIGQRAFEHCTTLETVNLPAAHTIGSQAFASCTALVTVNFPAAQTIDYLVFNYCSSLAAVNLPVVHTIGDGAFRVCTSLETVNLPAAQTISGGYYFDGVFAQTGNKALTVTLGPTAPTLGYYIFSGVNVTKAVTVKVPSGAGAWTGKTGTFSGAEKTGGPHWGEGFRGRGWTSGGAYENNGVNTYINLKIEEYTP